jgi:hypothetical protein
LLRPNIKLSRSATFLLESRRTVAAELAAKAPRCIWRLVAVFHQQGLTHDA